jgi:hypothetical protein
MKKIIYITIILAAAAFMLPQIAAADGGPEEWAEGTYTLGSGGGEADEPAEYELSSNVWIYYTADAAFVNYGLGSLHKSGNRSYATSNVTTLIFWDDKSTGDTQDTEAEASPGDAADSFDGDPL